MLASFHMYGEACAPAWTEQRFRPKCTCCMPFHVCCLLRDATCEVAQVLPQLICVRRRVVPKALQSRTLLLSTCTVRRVLLHGQSNVFTHNAHVVCPSTCAVCFATPRARSHRFCHNSFVCSQARCSRSVAVPNTASFHMYGETCAPAWTEQRFSPTMHVLYALPRVCLLRDATCEVAQVLPQLICVRRHVVPKALQSRILLLFTCTVRRVLLHGQSNVFARSAHVVCPSHVCCLLRDATFEVFRASLFPHVIVLHVVFHLCSCDGSTRVTLPDSALCVFASGLLVGSCC